MTSYAKVYTLVKQSNIKYEVPAAEDIFKALAEFKHLIPEIRKLPDGGDTLSLILHGTIPISHKGSTYPIPLGLIFFKDHPYEAPYCFFSPTSSMKIRVSQFVADDGRILLPYLIDWQYPRHDTGGLLQHVTDVFEDNCPVYSVSSGSSKPWPKASGSQVASPKSVSYPMSSSNGVPQVNSSSSCRCSDCAGSGDGPGTSMFGSNTSASRAPNPIETLTGISDLVGSITGSVVKALTLGPADSDEEEAPFNTSIYNDDDEEEEDHFNTSFYNDEEEAAFNASVYDDDDEVPFCTYGEAEPFAFGSGVDSFSPQWSSTSTQSSKTTYGVGQSSTPFGASGGSGPTRSQSAVKAGKPSARKAPVKVECVKKVLPQSLETPYRHNVYGLPTNAIVVLYCDVPWPGNHKKEFLTIDLCADNDIAMQVLIKAQARVELPTPITVQCRQNGKWHHIQHFTLNLSGCRHKFKISVRKNDYQVNIAGHHVVNYGQMIAPSAISTIRITGCVRDSGLGWQLEIYGVHSAQ